MKPNTNQWHSRGYLPHLDSLEHLQSITFRLADSLPRTVLDKLKNELKKLPNDQREIVKRKEIEHWLDSGMGCCALRNPDMAAIMQESLLRFDGIRYRLLCWCIMPNHVHILIKPEETLCKIVQSWKSYTGRWALKNSAELVLGVPRVWPYCATLRFLGLTVFKQLYA